MKKKGKVRKNRQSKKKRYGQSMKSIAVVLLIAIVGVLCFLKFYDYYIYETLYAERLSQMSEVTTQLYAGLEDVVANQWRKTSNSCRKLLDQNPKSQEDFLQFMEKQAYLEDFDSQQLEFIAVDQNGKYYTQSGEQGLLAEREYLASLPEQISFVSNSLTYDESKMYFLQKLSEPITFDGTTEECRIQYFGVSQNMEQLNPYFNCKAYDGNNSVYVVDANGLKLFSSSSSGDLLKSFNVFNSLDSLKYLHGSSFTDTKKELDTDKLAYSNAVLNGEEIYYSLYKMDHAEWVLVFLVPSQYVAINTVKLINMTIRLVLAFATGLVLVSVITIFLLMKNQQRLALAAEKKNNEILEKVNEELKLAAQKAECATQAAEAASKAKTDFLANMSHDIRTPMNAIVGITGLMEHENGISDKMHGYIDKVQLSSKHLLGLINDILDMSRIESKEVQLNVESVSLAEQISQIDTIIRAQANERHQKFHIHVDNVAHEYLICDGVRLRQVVLNLLSNAVKYTQNGGDIRFDLMEVSCDKKDHAKFVITVTDNGYGMTPDFVKHIFEPFTRAENSVTNKIQGTGLGMAITKNIVDLMGGEIHVESELGRGSRFEVLLMMPIDRKKSYTLGEKKVLLISGEERLKKNVRVSFNEVSTEFSCVSTVEEATEWLTKEQTDIILLSGCIKNTMLSGTVESLRRMSQNAVLIFGVEYVQDEKAEEYILKSGVDGVIDRPFFFSNLEMAIARTIMDSVSDTENTSILKGMRFLCAEDNELNAEILKEILQMYDADCTICSNGEEIVQTFKNVKAGEYDAILMDVQMPKMNGLEATRAIRNGSNPLGKQIPIIAMTANAFSEDVQHCIGAGMDAHVAKPIDIAALEKTLRNFVAGGGDNQAKA